MKLRSLSTRLFIVTAVALAPALVIAVSSILTLQRDRELSLHAYALRTAELASLELEQTINGVESVLRTLAAASDVERGDEAACSALLSEVVGALDFLSSIAIANVDGSPRCWSERSTENEDYSTRAYFREALAATGRAVGTATDGSSMAQRRLPVALRINTARTGVDAVAVGYLDLNWLEQRLSERRLTPGGSFTIADRNGTIIARMPEPERFVGTTIPDAFRHLVDAPTSGSIEVVSQDGTRRVLGYVPPAANGSGLYLSAGLSTAEGYATLRSVAARAAAISVGGAVIAALLAYYTASRFIAKPVRRVIDTVSAWRRGDSTARTEMDARDGEICGAGQALDVFMDEFVANREARQKAEEDRALLSDELEHRVKNLLATVQAIAKQTIPRSGNEAALDAFSQRLQAIGEANRLLKHGKWESTPLRALVQASLAPFTDDDPSRLRLDGPDLVVNGKVAMALSMALHELCTNATKYGALSIETGSVSIFWEVTEAAEGDEFRLVWQERGGPVVQTPDHTGFGSKVVKQVLAIQLGGEVELTYAPLGVVCRVVAPANSVLIRP